jgi:hypothetical protein
MGEKMKKKGSIHFADFIHSNRLQRVARFLAGREKATTWQIIHGARVAAVNSAVDELRCNGFSVRASRGMYHRQRIWFYELLGQPAKYRALIE